MRQTHAMGVNVGREKAQEAAELVGGYTLLPPFKKTDSGSDWNDFRKVYGTTETQNQIQSVLRLIDIKNNAQIRIAEKAIEQSKEEQAKERKASKDMSLSLSR